ncbi:hypothetical protein ABLN72_10555, partial [Mycobacterium tuberculosis]
CTSFEIRFGCFNLQASQHFHCFRIYRVETLFRVFRARFNEQLSGQDALKRLPGGRGLTRRRRVSTLEQSPESRRCGCDLD